VKEGHKQEKTRLGWRGRTLHIIGGGGESFGGFFLIRDCGLPGRKEGGEKGLEINNNNGGKIEKGRTWTTSARENLRK